MSSDHLSPGILFSFLRGELAQLEVTRHLSHVLGCDDCKGLIRRELNRHRNAPSEGYAKSFLEALSSVVDHEAPLAMERIAAPGLAARLHSLTWRQRRLLLANDRRYRTWGLCERLIHESRRRTWNLHPDEMLDWARTALLVGEHMDPRQYGEPHFADLMADVQTNLANAHRLRSEFGEARRHLELARDWLQRGSGDDLEKVRLASYEASLLISLGHFERAVDKLGRQCKRLVSYREHDLQAKLLVQQGAALGYYDPAEAIAVYRRALDLIDARKSPRLALCARQGLIWCLNASGHSQEALIMFQSSQRLFRHFPDRWAQLHLRWTEARLSFDLGKVEEADSAYQALWTEAFELDLRLETALISLDLIEIQLALDNYREAAHLAHRLVDMFEAWNVNRRAMQAWTLLVDALRQESASREQVTELALFLRRAWKNPEFELRA